MALPQPTCWIQRTVPLPDSIMPREVSSWPNLQLSAATMMSQASISSMPTVNKKPIPQLQAAWRNVP